MIQVCFEVTILHWFCHYIERIFFSIDTIQLDNIFMAEFLQLLASYILRNVSCGIFFAILVLIICQWLFYVSPNFSAVKHFESLIDGLSAIPTLHLVWWVC